MMGKIIFIKFPVFFLTEAEAAQEKLDEDYVFPNDGAGSDIVEIKCEITEIAQYWPSKGFTVVYTHAGNYRSSLSFAEFDRLVEGAADSYNGTLPSPASALDKSKTFSQYTVQRCPDCNNVLWPETLKKSVCRICGRVVV